jgi:hypothetical protein
MYVPSKRQSKIMVNEGRPTLRFYAGISLGVQSLKQLQSCSGIDYILTFDTLSMHYISMANNWHVCYKQYPRHLQLAFH